MRPPGCRLHLPIDNLRAPRRPVKHSGASLGASQLVILRSLMRAGMEAMTGKHPVDRRRFLQIAGGAAAATALSSSVARAAPIAPAIRTRTIKDVEHIVVLRTSRTVLALIS